MSSIDPMQPGQARSVSIPQQTARLPVAAIALTRMLAQLHTGRLRLIDPQGRVQDFGPGGEPQVSLQLASWNPITALMRRGDVGFAQAWIDGEWTTDNLTGLMMLASLNRSVLESAVFGTWVGQLLDRLRHLILRDNSLAGSRRNIAAHYDLGNAFMRSGSTKR